MTFKNYVLKICKQLRIDFLLGEYKMSVTFPEKQRKNYYADISIDPTYLSFNINVYPLTKELYDRKDYAAIAEILTHEMAHVLTEPLHLLAKDKKHALEVCERQTQRITNVVFSLLPSKLYYVKPRTRSHKISPKRNH